MALDLALAVQQEITARLDETDRLRHRAVERAQYEADQARQRYMQVDPANRLVAGSLETDWNAKLRALGEAHEDYQRQRTADRLAVDENERQRIVCLATDFPAIWRDPNTPQRERKRMLGLLIEDVTLIKQRQITVAVRFRGGATTTLSLPRPLTAQQLRVTHEDVRRQIDTLLDEYTDAQAAEDGEESDQQRCCDERGAHFERHRGAEQNRGRGNPVLDARNRHTHESEHSAHRHDQGKRNRQHPDGGGAELRTPQAHGDHRQHVVQSRDRMKESGQQTGGLGLLHMRERGLRPNHCQHRDRAYPSTLLRGSHRKAPKSNARRCTVQNAPSVPTV